MRMEMGRRMSRWMALAGFASLFAAGCVLDPLDEISESPNAPDDGEDAGGRRDAGTKPRNDAGSNAVDSGMRGDAGMRADAGGADTGTDAAMAPCRPAAGAECDPVNRCGCAAGERCEVRPIAGANGTLSADVAKCFADSGGTRQADAYCESDADCAAGHTCGGYVCRRYCKSDADCDGEACSPAADASGQIVDGLRFCLTSCDPTSPGTCEDSVCLPTTRETWPNAFCFGLREGSQAAAEAQPLYAVCDRDSGRFPNCDDGLLCIGGNASHHGHCLPYCTSDADCPAAVPTCMKDGTSWADVTTEIGFCYTNQCNEYSVFEPEPYAGAKPWTAAQYASCTSLCGSDLACQTANCPNAAAFQGCIEDAQIACVAALDGPCRDEYVALSCCTACENAPDFLTCTQQMCPAQYQAWNTCFVDPDCAATIQDVCVQD